MGQNYNQLNQKERDQIAIYRSKGVSFASIGKLLGRSGSSISREYSRNVNTEGEYLSSEAQNQSFTRKKEATEKNSKCEVYEDEIYSYLREGWTPEKIASKLSKDKKNFSVSHESIYSFIYKYHADWSVFLSRKR